MSDVGFLCRELKFSTRTSLLWQAIQASDEIRGGIATRKNARKSDANTSEIKKVGSKWKFGAFHLYYGPGGNFFNVNWCTG